VFDVGSLVRKNKFSLFVKIGNKLQCSYVYLHEFVFTDGGLMVNYRGKLKDLIVGLSQRLEIVIESKTIYSTIIFHVRAAKFSK